jgi:anti-anti-sigma factor
MTDPGLNILRGRGALDPILADDPTRADAFFGRIEEWVVSTLDDRIRPSADEEWMKSLEGVTLSKRPSRVRDGPSSTPTPLGGWARFRLSRRRGVTVVSLTDQALIKEDDLAELTGDLLALVEAGHRRIVLDFFAVERLSSWAARAIDEAVRRGSSAEGSAVKFSGLRPDVATIFAMTGLDPRVVIAPDTSSAIGGDWPELPELRPLPVSILAALMRAGEARPPVVPRVRSRGGPHARLAPDLTGKADEDPIAMNLARLIVQDGPSMGRPVAIRGPRFMIGRGPKCQLRVGSAAVSRSHAAIERRGSRLFLRDLASTNGTLLNGQALRDREAEIRDGDRIQIGKFSFCLSIGRPEQAQDLVDGLFRPDEQAGSAYPENPGATEEFSNLDGLGEEIGLRHEVIEGALIVTPLASGLDEESDVDAFREALVTLFEKRLPRRVVVNLSHVGHLSGRAIGVLVAHHLRLDRSGGALRVCLASPRVALVLEQVKLGMLVDYHPTVEDAVITAWPQPAAASCRA